MTHGHSSSSNNNNRSTPQLLNRRQQWRQQRRQGQLTCRQQRLMPHPILLQSAAA
jgi:hypothetical protein